MKETTARLLAYSRDFFVSSERDMDDSSATSYMHAILKMHDSIEYAVRAVIEEKSINHDKNMDLMPLIKAISQQTSQSVPMASQIDFINSTRGKIKHHASLPSVEDTQRCHSTTKEFLGKFVFLFLGIDFSTVSRSRLIEIKNIREVFEDAEQKIGDGDYLESLILTKKAYYLSKPSESAFLKKDNFFNGFFLTAGLQDFEPLKAIIEKIAGKINEVEENVGLLMMGVDILKLRRFNEITPQFDFFVGGTCAIYWCENNEADINMAYEALNYAIDMALYWQKRGVISVSPVHYSMMYPNRYTRWKEIRREKWHYL